MKLKHEGHVITRYPCRDLFGKLSAAIIETVPETCPACRDKREQAHQAHIDLLESCVKDSSILRCDICRKKIGYIKENDIEGSNFFCNSCHTKNYRRKKSSQVTPPIKKR